MRHATKNFWRATLGTRGIGSSAHVLGEEKFMQKTHKVLDKQECRVMLSDECVLRLL
jgi:hypothetical protein